jgi:hypothetical protein
VLTLTPQPHQFLPDGPRFDPYRLGFDRLANTESANRELVLNATDYLLDDTGLIAVHGKQITLRPLDKVKLAEQRRRWQLLNLGAPLLLLGVFGAVRAWRRYAALCGVYRVET